MALSTVLVIGVVAGGTGGAIAIAGGGSSSGNAARSQYCPPASANGKGDVNSKSQSDTGKRCGQQPARPSLGSKAK
jgi:hypothetical protein